MTLGIAVVALASSLAPSKAQAQENFAWITNTNGVTWKKKFHSNGYLTFQGELRSERPKIAEILVPEHAKITYIEAYGCVNLTNIILLPSTTTRFDYYDRPIVNGKKMWIAITDDSGLRTIACKKTMRDLIWISGGSAGFHEGGWSKEWSVQWIDLEPPQIAIRKITDALTGTVNELEIIWRNGMLQIADAVNGKWEDYSGPSPLRVSLAVNSKAQHFFRIKKRESTAPSPTQRTDPGPIFFD